MALRWHRRCAAVASLRDADRRLLWGRSGNECAFRDCGAALIEAVVGKSDSKGHPIAVAVGEEAHIVAVRDDGPRGDPSMPLSERNSYHNMILLCPAHHVIVDRENGRYFTVQELHVDAPAKLTP
ncbi:HNH endonuclease [Kitasatospora sp. NPDC028055]|uniref:HNH endonuclease n=1 Tax=Kitasatospora sp. NPDC028055 TaxID=3155653 RepID=UPI0033C2B136